jgi:large subunit ribosomal protein L23
MRSTDIIKTIRMSEKALQLRDLYDAKRTEGMTEGNKPAPQYTFQVDRRANKYHIRQAIRDLFPKVTVTSVNTMNVRGKPKRQNTRLPGYAQNWKKAIVTLKEGDSIDEMI